LPDEQRPVGDISPAMYNTAVDMHSKSFSAHLKTKVHAELKFEKKSVPSYYYLPDKMYVVFVGSHNVPAEVTGLGKGYYAGYIATIVSREDNNTIWYGGESIIQYEMSGQYPIYISDARPAIDKYNATLVANWPTVNIASEEATNAVNQLEQSEKIERHQEGATMAIIAVSFAAARPPVNELIDHYLKHRRKSIDRKDYTSGYGGKTTNDH
jgi:hypothetical protein